MQGREITLPEILDAREQRVLTQKRLLETYQVPLICFTMNIPGPVKQTPLIARSFGLGCRLLRDALDREKITVLHWQSETPDTGCVAYCAADASSVVLKTVATAIEDSFPLGRLFDMDVLDTEGQKLDRELVGGKSRDCIVCGAPGRGCASRRLHSVSQLQNAAEGLLLQHFTEADALQISRLVTESLLEEVRTTPKPGLVDLRNTGSHKDMNADTFSASAWALEPYFRRCVRIGQQTASLTPRETFLLLREAGIAAEKTMLEATGGVNTHKGAIFTMGILCGGLGRLWTPEGTALSIPELLSQCAEMGAAAAAADFPQNAADTAGLLLYRSKGLTGIRGEVAAGLPAVKNISLPAFQNALAQGLSRNDAGVIALLHLIANVEDTNLYHRGGEAGAAYAKESAAGLLRTGTAPSRAQLETLDDAFIARNLSPGGCADLLAVTYFLDFLTNTPLPDSFGCNT